MTYSQSQKALSYNDFIQNIRSNHPLVLRANNLISAAEFNFKAARGEYDPNVSGIYNEKYFTNSNYYSSVQSEIKQPIFTSQYLKAGYELGQGPYLNPENNTSTYGLPYVGIEASLLQGLLFDKRRADVLKAKENINLTTAERNDIVNTLLFEAALIYSEWSFITREQSIYTKFLGLAKERNIGISALSLIGEKPIIDTVEAAILYQNRLLEFQSISVENQKQLAKLRSLNWTSSSNVSYTDNYLASDTLESLYTKCKNQYVKLISEDSINNPIIAQFQSRQKLMFIEKRLRSELIKPKLDVNYNFLSNNSNTLSGIANFSTNSYKWGASLSFPLLLRTSRNQFKVAALNFQNSKLQLSSKENELMNKLELVKQSLNIITEQILNSSMNVVYNKRLVEAEKLKFDNGESSLFLLNLRESRWLESEIKLAQYKFKFVQNIFQLIYLKGKLNYQI